jgi:hypothetical protein
MTIHTTAACGEACPPRYDGTLEAHARYRAFGLDIASQVALPELMLASGNAATAADVEIRLASIPSREPHPVPYMHIFSEEELYFSWQQVGRFRVVGTGLIEIDPAPGVDERLLALPLLGPVLGMLLHRRGHLILHASATTLGGRCAIFVGDKGAGKSTTAAALLEAGHALLTDDLVVLSREMGNAAHVELGFPQLKLSENAAQAVRIADAFVEPSVHPAILKRQHRVPSSFATTPIPARRIYLLQRGETAAVEPLSAKASLLGLMQFSYVTRFGRDALQGSEATRHLDQCARLAGLVGMRRLTVPNGLDRLPEIAALVREDLASDS